MIEQVQERKQQHQKGAKPKIKHLRVKTALACLFLMLVVSLAWYLTSPQFREHMRRALVSELERVTGGRVELGTLDWNLSRLEIEVYDLTIHGLEPPGEVPYAHADRVYAKLKILSFLGRELGLRELALDHPVLHLIVRPDGSTNQPQPKIRRAKTDKNGVEQLFELAVTRVDVRNGWFIFNEHRTPLDFNVVNLGAAMSYNAPAQRYDSYVRIGKTDVKLESLRPFAVSADADFSIFRDHIQLNKAALQSDAGRVQASGTVNELSDPRATLNYTFNLNLQQLGRITRTRELQSGAAEIKGTANVWRQNFNTAGKLTLTDGAYSDPDITLRNIIGGLEFSADPERVLIPRLFAHVLGGAVNGEAKVLNWRAPRVSESERASTAIEQQGTVRLQVQGASLNALLAAISNRQYLPLDTLNAAGTVGGDIKVAWRGSPANAVTEVATDVVPPASAATGQLPVTAHGRAVYRTSVLELSNVEVTTPASRVTASGAIGRASQSVRISANTSNLAEAMPLIDALRPSGPMPVQFNGAASFVGTASGKLSWPTFAGHFEAHNFGTLVPKLSAPPGAAEQSTSVIWDSVAGDIVYDSTHAVVRNGVLRRADSELRFDFNTQLKRGRPSPEIPLSVHAAMRNGDVGELQRLFGYSYPVTGKLDFDINTAGLRTDQHGHGHVRLRNAMIQNQPMRSIDSDLKFEGSRLELTNLLARGTQGTVTGEGRYDFNSSLFDFAMRGSDLALENITALNSEKFQTSGRYNFSAKASGTFEQPVINGDAQIRALTINGHRFGDLDLDAVTRDSTLHAKARSSFQNANLALDGDVQLHGDFPASAQLEISSANLNPLLAAFLPVKATGPTVLSAHADFSGPLRSPLDLRVDLIAKQLSGELEKVAIQNQGPVHIRMANRVVTVDQLRLGGETNRFLEVRGTAEVAGQRRLAFSADGNVNLRLLQTFYPGLMSSGAAGFNLAVAGTMAHPAFDGELKIQNGTFNYIDLPNGLSDVNGSLAFNRNRLQVQTLTARTGGGLVDLGGFITYDRGLAFNLTARGRDIRIRYPAGVSSTADADLALVGNLKAATLSGDITVTRFGLNQEFDFGSYLAKTKEPPVAPNADSPLNNIHLDVHVLSTPELQVQTSLAKIAGNVDLHLRGTGTRPALLGRVNIAEGELSFNGARYHLERGDISFSNPVRIEPVLNLEATATVRDYDITLEFHGPMDKLKTNYRSDPPLPTGDIIALLALGRTRNETEAAATTPGSQQQPPTITESTTNALLGQALNATVSSRMQKLFGVSRIKIDPQVGGPETNANARVTIEQQVSNKVTLTYISNLTQSAQQVIQFEYNVNRNVSVRAVRDQNGIVGVEVRVRQRKK